MLISNVCMIKIWLCSSEHNWVMLSYIYRYIKKFSKIYESKVFKSFVSLNTYREILSNMCRECYVINNNREVKSIGKNHAPCIIPHIFGTKKIGVV